MTSLIQQISSLVKKTPLWLAVIFVLVVIGGLNSFFTQGWFIYLGLALAGTIAAIILFLLKFLPRISWFMLAVFFLTVAVISLVANTSGVFGYGITATAVLFSVEIFMASLVIFEVLARRDTIISRWVFFGWFGATSLLIGLGKTDNYILGELLLSPPLFYLLLLLGGTYFIKRFVLARSQPDRQQKFLQRVLIVLLSVLLLLGAGALLFPALELRIITNILLTMLIAILLGLWRQPNPQGTAPEKTGGSVKIKTLIILLLIFIGGVCLRLYQLDALQPIADELEHMLAAKSILAGTSHWSEVYSRSFWFLTVPVLGSFKVFGETLWAARLPGVIFNMLAIFPIFYILRRVSFRAGFIGAVLFTLSPWMISLSRLTREYAYLPFWFSAIFLLLIIFLEQIPKHTVLSRDWRKLINFKNVFLFLLLVFPIIYTIQLDSKSTSILITLIYPGAFLVFLFRLDYHARSSRILLIIVLALIPLGLFLASGYQHSTTLIPEFQEEYLALFKSSAEQQWYFNQTLMLPLLAFAISVLAWLYTKKTVIFLILAAFICNLYVLSFHFDRDFRARFASPMELWYLLILAIGLYLVWQISLDHLPKRPVYWWLTTATLIVLLINPYQVAKPLVMIEHDRFHPITGYFHDNFEELRQYLSALQSPDDAILGSVYVKYHEFYSLPPFRTMQYYNHASPMIKKTAFEFIDNNPQGWLVISTRFIKKKFPPLSDFSTGEKEVRFQGQINVYAIYEWGHKKD